MVATKTDGVDGRKPRAASARRAGNSPVVAPSPCPGSEASSPGKERPSLSTAQARPEGIQSSPASATGRAWLDHLGAYRGLLEAAPDAMLVVDQGGRIVVLNVQAE